MRRVASAVVLVWFAACASRPIVGPRASAPELELTRFGRFEVTFPGVPDAEVRGEFVAPSGRRLVIPGFWDGEHLRVRFTPVEQGTYRYSIVVSDAPAREGTFRVAGEGGRGFVRRDPRDAHSLAFEDGTRFIALGENRFNVYDPTWNYAQMEIEPYLAFMAEHGMNTIRLFVFTDCEDESRDSRKQPGCLEPEVGVFDPDVARTYDRILTAAEKQGIYVIFTAFAIGFTPAPDTWKSWDDNPYNAKNGGPVTTGEEFLERGDAQERAKRRFEYLLARYGYSPSFLAIDLINEPEWDGELGEESFIPWAEVMARAWKERDPYGHLVTLGSVGLHWNVAGDERPWYASPLNDWLQWHLYGEQVHSVHGMAAEMTRKVKETWRYDKPILCGEFGFGGEDRTLFDHTHAGIWAAVMSGASVLAHSAPPFTYDSDVPMTPDRARHFLVLSRFLRSLSPQEPLIPEPKVSATGASSWAVRAGEMRAIWLLAPPEGYGEDLKDVTVTLGGLSPGVKYEVEFVDDVTGASMTTLDVAAGEGQGEVTLPVPPFARHVAARLTPRRP